jgi:hypothetical protein
MRVVKAARGPAESGPLQPRWNRREGRSEIHELGQQAVQFATFPETVVPYYPYFSFMQPAYQIVGGREHLKLLDRAVTVPSAATHAFPMPPRTRPSRFSLTSALMACICHMTRWRASSLLTRMRAQPGWRKISTRRSRGYSRQPHCDAQASCFDWRLRSN